MGLAALLLMSCDSQRLADSPVSSSPASAVAPEPPVENPLWLGAIQRLDERTGFIAFWNRTGPTLARTSDAGLTWHAVALPAERISTIRFIDSRVGWVTGFSVDDQQLVLRTDDGGATWQQTLAVANAPASGPLLQVQAVDGQAAWALVQPCESPMEETCSSELRQTSDGGRTWTTVARGGIVAERFVSGTTGWTVHRNGYMDADVYKTRDAGFTWTMQTHLDVGDVVGFDAANALTAWVVSRDGGYCTASTCERYQIERTTDGGASWRKLGNPKDAGGSCSGGQLAGPVFATPMQGWFAENTGAGGAAASTGVLRSDDAGSTWHCESSPSQTTVISAADPRHLWAARQYGGADSSLYASDDGGLTWRPLNLAGLSLYA